MVNKDLNSKLDLIIKNQKKILSNEEKILGEENKIEKLEREELRDQKIEASSLDEIKKLEEKLSRDLSSPMKKITKRDFAKGFIGASVGVMSHFAFSKAAEISIDLGMIRATILYIVAFIMIILMLYYTGFRTVHKKTIFKFLPMRATNLYLVSIFAILLINAIFGKIHLPLHFAEIYTLIGANIILAVMGAGTADLIGRHE